MANGVLFLCTGNYYRSRFAEIVFNALAAETGVDWRAESRGLALETGTNNVGPMSTEAVTALKQRDISSADVERYPIQVEEKDLEGADLIIALKASEHREYVSQRHPGWIDSVEYWDITDVVPSATYDPLAEIEMEVRRLMQRLSTGKP